MEQIELNSSSTIARTLRQLTIRIIGIFFIALVAILIVYPNKAIDTSHYEIITYDPFIESILDGSKNMVFIVGHVSDVYHYCNELEKLIGEIITLRAYGNYSLGSEQIVRIIKNVLIKSIKHINLMNDLIGDSSNNCGYCGYYNACYMHYCKVAETHRIYSWFEPNTSSNVIIENVFSSYQRIFSDYWNYNHRKGVDRTCSGYSVASVNGYYFQLGDRVKILSNTVTSHITHTSMNPFTFIANDPRNHQCFIEIELAQQYQ